MAKQLAWDASWEEWVGVRSLGCVNAKMATVMADGFCVCLEVSDEGAAVSFEWRCQGIRCTSVWQCCMRIVEEASN